MGSKEDEQADRMNIVWKEVKALRDLPAPTESAPTETRAFLDVCDVCDMGTLYMEGAEPVCSLCTAVKPLKDRIASLEEALTPPHVHARRLEVVRTLLYVADPAGLLYAGGSDEDYDPYAGPLVEILESDATEAKCGDLISDHFCFPVNQSVVRRLVRAYFVLAP